jgi:hypothetical protein
VRDAAEAERDVLDAGYATAVEAAASLDVALASDGPHVVRIPRRRLAEARRVITQAWPDAKRTARPGRGPSAPHQRLFDQVANFAGPAGRNLPARRFAPPTSTSQRPCWRGSTRGLGG